MTQYAEEPLENIATITMGTSPSGDTYNNDGVGLPLLNGPTEFGMFYPSCTLFTTDSKKQCEVGDLIFCVRGSTGRMNWADRVYSLGRGVCSIHGETRLDTKFIKYGLDYKLNALLAIAGGGTFPNLTKSDIHTFPIPYPRSRYKIAAILSAYDDLIENNSRRIAILEQMAQLLYREWFVHFRFPGHEDVAMVEAAEIQPSEGVSPITGKIPEGWDIKTLKDFCHLTLGVSPKSKYYNETGEGLPFHQGVSDFGEIFPTTTRYCTVTKRVAHDGDILFSVRAPVGRINLADRQIVIGRGLHAIRSKTEHQFFVLLQLMDKFKEEDQVGSGTIFKAVTKKDMLGIQFLVPPADLRDRFEDMASTMYTEIENLTRKNQLLRRTRDLLLPRLISGEVDVSELEITIGG